MILAEFERVLNEFLKDRGKQYEDLTVRDLGELRRFMENRGHPFRKRADVLAAVDRLYLSKKVTRRKE